MADLDTGPDRPIILLGCPRSGTTLLQLMLHQHPRIAIPPENRFVLAAYQSRAEFGDLTDPANRRRLAEWIVRPKSTRFKDLGLDADAVAAEIEAGPPTLGSALGIVLRAYAARHGKPRWGDKRPAYSRYLDEILRLFPDAQVIHLMRDGRDCVASLLEMPWWKGDFYDAVCAWAQASDEARRARRRLPADSFHLLRYEDLVADPYTHLSALCAFLGEEYDPAMKTPQEVARKAVPKRKHWHQRTHEQVTTARVGGFAARLTPEQVSLCETVLASRLRANGYELTGAMPAPVSERLHYTRVSMRRRNAVRKARIGEWWQRVREDRPVAAQLTSGQVARPTGRR